MVGAAFIIAYLSYSHLSATLEQASQSVFERIAQERQRTRAPAGAGGSGGDLLRCSVHLQARSARLDSLHSFAALRTSQTTAAVCIGYEDGAFFLVRRLSNDGPADVRRAQGAAILVKALTKRSRTGAWTIPLLRCRVAHAALRDTPGLCEIRSA